MNTSQLQPQDYALLQRQFQSQQQQSSGQNQSSFQSDPNSPEMFKQNIQIVQQQVARLQAQARSVLASVQNAYHFGNNPAQTEANFISLKETIAILCDMLRSTGVGALPLIPQDPSSMTDVSPPDPPTEAQLLVEATRGVQVLFEQMKRGHESAAVAANLLGAQATATGGGR